MEELISQGGAAGFVVFMAIVVRYALTIIFLWYGIRAFNKYIDEG